MGLESATPVVTPALTAATGQNADDVLAVLSAAFDVVADRPRRERRTWLDTVDWRLHRAGLTLAELGSTRSGRLVLSGPDGSPPTEQSATVRWPARADALPDGPVRDQVIGPVEMRALLPLATEVVVSTSARLLDAEGKTVLRLRLDTTEDPEAGVRIELEPLRGYGKAAGRAGRLLVAAGAVATSTGLAEAAFVRAGRQPGDYSNKLATRLRPDAPARHSLARVLLDILDGIEANVPGTIEDLDTEYLHDLRVNVRRTRAALKLTPGPLPAGVVEEMTEQFRWLGALTSPTRDIDVHLLELAGRPASESDDLAPLVEYLSRRRRTERRRLTAGLRSPRFAALVTDWRAELTALADNTRPARPATAEFAAQRIGHAHQRLLRRGRAITADSAPEQLHALRKRGKELRYLLEFFGSIYEPSSYRRVIGELKDLQDLLGQYQDAHVQRAALLALAEDLTRTGRAPARTLLAMGRLSGELARVEQARDEFDQRFTRFARPANQRRLDAMLAAPIPRPRRPR